MKDVNGVRTAQDLERKYDFSSIGKLKKNYELQQETLTKVENELSDFVIATTRNIEDLQDQVDGNITTWFSSGTPTISNYPASDWTTIDEKNNHLGDLYYDRQTGYGYRFCLDNNVYSWISIKDTDVTRALALANSAQDTADSKRRVFISQPSPPYDVGDLWINNQELYRCQTTKDGTQSYEANDWIKATKYTDDTVANQVGNNLTILSGTVTEIRNDVDDLTTTMTNTTSLVNEQGTAIGNLQIKTSQTEQTVDEISSRVSDISTNLNNDYTNNDELNQVLEEQRNTITTEMSTYINQTRNEVTTEIYQRINEDGVEKLKNTLVTINQDGINVSKSDEDVISLLDNNGLYVSDGKLKNDQSNLLMKTDRNGAYFKTINIQGTMKDQDLFQKEKINHNDYGICQAWYWIGG